VEIRNNVRRKDERKMVCKADNLLKPPKKYQRGAINKDSHIPVLQTSHALSGNHRAKEGIETLLNHLFKSISSIQPPLYFY
jgi:hypothetical protein